MSYSPGDWVELVRTVDGSPAGLRGKVTSTGFVGDLDIELADGTRLTGVDVSAVKAAPPSPSSGDGGCGLALIGLASGSAAVLGAAIAAWTRARWGA